MNRTARPTVCTAVLCEDEEHAIAVVRRSKPPRDGAWTLPGGHLNYRELAEDGARRELKEETDLAAPVLTFIGVHEHLDDQFHLVILVYLAESVCGLEAAGDDAAEAAWMPVDMLTHGNSTWELIEHSLSLKEAYEHRG